MPEATAFHLPWLRAQPDATAQAVRERLELGAVTPAVSYIQAQQARRRIVDEFLAANDGSRFAPYADGADGGDAAGRRSGHRRSADPEVLAALINFTGPFDLTGFPAISVPCGFTAGGLPVGLQLVARPWEEASAARRRPRLRAGDDMAPMVAARGGALRRVEAEYAVRGLSDTLFIPEIGARDNLPNACLVGGHHRRNEADFPQWHDPCAAPQRRMSDWRAPMSLLRRDDRGVVTHG